MLETQHEADAAEAARLRARVAELEARLAAATRIGSVAADTPLGEAGGEAFLRLAFDDGPLAMAFLGTDQRVSAANAALAELLGRPVAELTGRTLAELSHPADRATGRHRSELLLRGEIDRARIERRLLRGDGASVWVEASMQLLRRSDGRPLSALVVFENVTARHEAEEALRRANTELELRVGERTLSLSRALDDLRHEMARRRRYGEDLRRSEAQLFALIENACDAIWSVDADLRLLTFNTVFRRRFRLLFGKEPEVGRTPHELAPPDLADYWTKLYHRALEGETFTDQQRYTLEGRERFYDISLNPIRSRDRIAGVAAFSRDLTDYQEAKEAIEADNLFKAQVLLAHERERQLTAYEIHDGLVQDVTGAKLHLEALRTRCERALARPEPGFDLVLRLLAESIDEGRRLISGLRPPIIDEQGIVAALDYLVREQMAAGGLSIEFRHDVQFRRLKPIWEGTLYRIVQEALANVRRHARTDRAEVELTQRGDRLRLAVRDRGVGFDVAAADGGRFGLRGIRERARLLEGHAEIHSAPGQGTEVVVDLPVVEAEPAGHNTAELP